MNSSARMPPGPPKLPLTLDELSERIQAAIAADLRRVVGLVDPSLLAEAIFDAAALIATHCQAPGGAQRWCVMELLGLVGKQPDLPVGVVPFDELEQRGHDAVHEVVEIMRAESRTKIVQARLASKRAGLRHPFRVIRGGLS